MKKLFLFVAALATLCSCNNKDVDEPTLPDAIKVSPATAQISRKGGDREVLVTSNGAWTLEGSCDWATPSRLEGEDGDIVRFAVEANETTEDRTVVYTFKSGTVQATYTLTSLKKASSEMGDILEIAPETETVLAAGGTVEVIVTSSEEWTLEAKETYDWVTTDRTAGEDGDTVLFTVSANDTSDERVAVYTFKSGALEAVFTLTNLGINPDYMTLTSPESVDVKTVGEDIVVTLDTNLNYRDIEQKIVMNEGEDWLTFVVAQPDSNGETAVLTFRAAANTSLANRTADITITAPENNQGDIVVEVHVDQFRQPQIESEKSIYTINLTGGELEIPLTTNVEYTATVSEDATDWLTVKSTAADKIVLDVTAGEESAQGDVTLTHESELGGTLTLKLTVLRKAPSLIEYVPDWHNLRAWPGDPSWNNASALNNLSSWTCEALVRMDERKTESALSTVFGIEGEFLIRFGDASVDHQYLQFVCPGMTYGSGSKNLFGTSATRIELGEWTHIAITKSGNNVTVYFNGEQKGTASTGGSFYGTGRFSYTSHNDESGSRITRCFWVSYAYEDVRYWPGPMCELRIWNRALSSDEINATNHFYTVENPDQDSSLVAYWKCNENDNSGVMKDYSGNGNDLKYDTSKPFTWIPVALGTPSN